MELFQNKPIKSDIQIVYKNIQFQKSVNHCQSFQIYIYINTHIDCYLN